MDSLDLSQRHPRPTRAELAGSAEAWNTYALNRELYLGNRTEAIAENPWLAEHPEITLSLDFLQYMEDNGLDDD
jgi:hypothetical protein